MTKRRMLAIIIALLVLGFMAIGVEMVWKSINNNNNNTAIETSTEETGVFSSIIVEDVDMYRQTYIYDTETNVEYVYLWHKGSGDTASTMLYMPDGTPKAYSGKSSKLIFIANETTGMYTQTLMYDSETLVMYSCSHHKGSGHITIEPLYNTDGTLKLY